MDYLSLWQRYSHLKSSLLFRILFISNLSWHSTAPSCILEGNSCIISQKFFVGVQRVRCSRDRLFIASRFFGSIDLETHPFVDVTREDL